MKQITCKPGDRVEVNILGGTREGTVEHVEAGEPLTINVDGYEFPMLVYPAEVKRVVAPAHTEARDE
jgi:autonomous glycyl radical cofactor GrcA